MLVLPSVTWRSALTFGRCLPRILLLTALMPDLGRELMYGTSEAVAVAGVGVLAVRHIMNLRPLGFLIRR